MAFNVREIFKVLADAGADYVVVGGFAVIMHGHLRATRDLDLDGIPIPIASIPYLVRMKQDAGRPQDHDDIRALQEISSAADRGGS